MSAGLTINVDQFSEALHQYVEESGRDAIDAVNKKAKDVSLTAARMCRSADKSAIHRLPDLWRFGNKMWVKHISNLLKNEQNWRVGKIGKRQQKALKKLLIYGQAGAVNATLRTIAAQSLSKKIVNSRIRAVGFVSHAFTMAARLVDPKSQSKLPPARGKSKAKGWARAANIGQGDKLMAQLFMSYENAHPEGAARVALPALQKAIDYQRGDMIAYIQRKMAENGRKYSAKGARRG